MRLFRDLGATDIELTMLCAASNGHESIVRLCYDWGAEDLDTVMAHAARYGHIRIVILCHRWGATNIEWAVLCAEEGGTKKLCKCVTSGPILTQIDRANVGQFWSANVPVSGGLGCLGRGRFLLAWLSMRGLLSSQPFLGCLVHNCGNSSFPPSQYF